MPDSLKTARNAGRSFMRIILALAVMASFNVLAIQLFISRNLGPITKILSLQQAMLISSFMVIIIDVVIIYFMIMFKTPSPYSSKEFDRLFKKYYNGKNSNEAFDRAKKEWLK